MKLKPPATHKYAPPLTAHAHFPPHPEVHAGRGVGVDGGVLVVTQRWDCHRELEQLLTTLRSAKAIQGPASADTLGLAKCLTPRPSAAAMDRDVVTAAVAADVVLDDFA
jgi:hypothetical protein